MRVHVNEEKKIRERGQKEVIMHTKTKKKMKKTKKMKNDKLHLYND